MIIKLLAFNLSTLNFGFHYYKCSSEIQFLSRSGRASQMELEHKKRINNIIYYVLFFLNFISCIAFGLIVFNEGIKTRLFGNPNPDTVLEISSRFSVGVMQGISFIFLTIGTFRIRKHLINANMRDSLNERMIWLHALSFLFYILCGIVFYVALWNYFRAP